MTKHTPGPWEVLLPSPRVRKRSGHIPSAMVRAGGTQAIECTNSGDTFEESAANARLIAAAPEMLEALKMARDTTDRPTVYRLLADLIAKAEGRS